MQTTAQDLIERAAKYDPSLAADIRAFAKAREFGLVFEHNRPEAMRLYGKKISKGDTVHILAPRGKAEKSENKVPWRVTKVYGQTAHLERVEGVGTSCDVDLSELVAVAAFEEPIYAGLREVGRVERGGDRPYQVVINGENYHALEALLFAYAGRADCIYIDPPYNTGARDWKYNNDYVDGTDEYRHSKWLAFMERRLRLAKQLLNPDDSVLICTIDEKEHLRLGLLLEQVFSDARIQMVSINVNPAAVARNNEFGRSDEYAFFVMYGNGPQKLPLTSDWIATKGRTHTGKVRWDLLKRSGTNASRSDRPNLFYPVFIRQKSSNVWVVDSCGKSLSANQDFRSVQAPEGCVSVWPIRQDGTEGNWQMSQDSLMQINSGGFVRLGSFNGTQTPIYYIKPGERKKIAQGVYPILGYAEDGSLITEESESTDYRMVPPTQWRIKSHDSTQYGTRLLSQFLGGNKFSFPKSLYAVEDTIRFFVANKPSALIIDFFSGSGTTAHATMRLNHQDGGNRRCICITNNEVSEAEAKKMTKQGFRQGDSEWEQYGICEYITKPRIEAAITGLTPEGNPIKGDYKFTDEFPMADGFEENAIFFDLTYQNPVVVDLDGAYEEVAPLLWMRAGCKGPIIETRGDGTYELSETYAILFNYAFAQDFVMELDARPEIQTVYVVTDDEGRYQSINQALKGRDVVQLYESYLRSFQIAAEGALI
ncbi:MAG: hypothetical protein LKH08_07080 [Atopobiaceae bacterium]|nr:hypothetical protein [Atopobiaceae bacterium]MCH4119646.1 hypothetical protein [Atopobiaceae bacterium]MCI1388717.1 hypothetical protein [Atopobiaceae bacterium]MCI1432663.1 hypothetical protein [Atopobiaceae bacterium]MCI1471000.1 hypothetical protein [Atopobiaceae bacterium]